MKRHGDRLDLVFAQRAAPFVFALASIAHGAACGSPVAPNPFNLAQGGQTSASGQGQGGQGLDGPDIDETLGGPCSVDAQCDDGHDCTLDACDLAVARCRFLPDDSSCQNGVVCDGQEVCSNKNGCIAGAPKTCSDGDPCTIDTCDEATATCKAEPRDADADGDPDVHCGGGDCNDVEPLASSKQAEVCENNVDDDCDGTVDEPECGKPQNDDCFAPLEVLEAGTYAMSTVAAKLDYPSSCALQNPPGARDVVAALTVPPGKHDVRLTARSDSADVTVALFGQCGKPGSELGCSAGHPHPNGGRVAKMRVRAVGLDSKSTVLPAIVATDYPAPLTLRYEVLAAEPVPTNETCGTATELIEDAPAKVPLTGVKKDLEIACATATGELVYRFVLNEPRNVDLFASSLDGDGRPVLSLRSEACAEAAAEVTCAAALIPGEPAHLFRHALPAGVHHVAVAATAPTDVLLTLKTSAPTPIPADETCAGSPTLVPGVTTDVPLVLHQDDIDSACLVGGIDAAYQLELGATSDVLVVGRYSAGDAAAVALMRPACEPEDGLVCAVGNISPTRARRHGLAKGAYRVVAESQGGLPMQLTAFVRPATPPTLVPFADGCADALVIPEMGGLFKGNTQNAKADYGAGCDQGNQPAATARDQLLKLVLPAPKRVAFDMQGSGYATLLSVKSGPACPGNELPKGCAAGYYPDRSFLDLTLAAGTYFVQVDGFNGQSGPWFLDVYVADLPK